MKNLRQQKAIRIVAALALTLALAGIAIPAQAQTFTSLHTFEGVNGNPPDGAYPSGLVQGANGYLYGTTFQGGTNFYGTVFKISTSGTTYTILDNFDSGSLPCCGDWGSIALATNGDFYGTVYENTSAGIYKLTPSGTLTAMLGSNDGLCTPTNECAVAPNTTMVQASNGDLYGLTDEGGAYLPPYGGGTIFKLTLGGGFTVLHSFCETQNSEGDCLDGHAPFMALVQGTNGILYGATHNNGAYDGGTIFKITTAGNFTTLYSFCAVSGCPDGAAPTAALVQGADGNFYGVTGDYGTGTFGGGGTFFTITPSGALTTLYSFCNLADCADGAYPRALILATDGNFYGLTGYGGANNLGTVFQMTPSGSLTTVHSFDGTDGAMTADFAAGSSLIQDTNGTFYGETIEGGACQTGSTCAGTVFSLSMGLGPFVKTLPTSGAVGSTVKILGNNLTGATSVTFNGTAATFTVVSSTEITTTVPSSATTGTVKVITAAHHTLSSNVAFQVP